MHVPETHLYIYTPTYTQTGHIPPLSLVSSSNESFSLGQRQEMSNQLTVRQEEREGVATQRR